MSNMEINLTGGEDTSGRATSESQERIERDKGIQPVVALVERKLNKDLIPQRWGAGFKFSYQSGLSEMEQIKMDKEKVLSGTYDVNKVREDRGDDPYEGEEFDLPQGAQQIAPDGSPEDPFSVEGL